MCLTIAINPKNMFEVRRAFTLLLMNLWIDAIPFQLVAIPNNIKVWKNLNSSNDFPCYNGDIEFLVPLKDSIIQTFITFKKKMHINDKHEIQYLDSVLELMFKMFYLGLFSDIETINMIIRELKELLIKRVEICQDQVVGTKIYYDYQKYGSINDENDIQEDKSYLKCKLKMCKILIFMLNIQTEIRMNFF